MPADPGDGVTPLDWPALVEEAIRRRKAEGLTQRAHAALAGVSPPTIIAFDRAETTLSLAKILDILRVVGLAAERPRQTPQDAFVAAARSRWRELVERLPEDAPTRHPHGQVGYDAEITGDLRPLTPRDLLEHMQWDAAASILTADLVEYWHGKPDLPRAVGGAADTDFRRASIRGRLYLQAGYREDTGEIVKPGAIFDVALPLRRAAEALVHAARFGRRIAASPTAELRFRAAYTGLAGRDLFSWNNPVASATHRSRVADATLSITAPLDSVEESLPALVHRLMAPLYDRFGGYRLAPGLVAGEIGA